MFSYLKTLPYLCGMKDERKIRAYGDYFGDFINSISDGAKRKIFYAIDMLKTGQRVSSKFVKYLRDDIFELRAEYNGNIYRVFFIFDDGNVVILFHGFQKKTQKTPKGELERALTLKEEYYEQKRTGGR